MSIRAVPNGNSQRQSNPVHESMCQDRRNLPHTSNHWPLKPLILTRSSVEHQPSFVRLPQFTIPRYHNSPRRFISLRHIIKHLPCTTRSAKIQASPHGHERVDQFSLPGASRDPLERTGECRRWAWDRFRCCGVLHFCSGRRLLRQLLNEIHLLVPKLKCEIPFRSSNFLELPYLSFLWHGAMEGNLLHTAGSFVRLRTTKLSVSPHLVYSN